MGTLCPVPFDRLVARAFEELARNDSVFDLPSRKFFTGDPAVDTSVEIHGHRVSTPLGASAGPHTQLAQNIVLAWLGGARVFELKTVQLRDELVIPRPCIDVRSVGYNIEWSQELKLEESLEEYVKASMLIEMLKASGAVPLAKDFDRHLFDMSVGYDLDGIRSERVRAFMTGLGAARETVDTLRAQIPAKWAHLRDLDFTTRIAPTVTVSTFHGCPVGEIEQICDFLLSEMNLDCTLKLNPTLLGGREVHEILHDRLGYLDVHVPPGAFEADPKWQEAVDFVGRLRERAASLGRSFAVKLTNTLVVENRSDFLPRSEKLAYLSGAPLHVIAMHLAARFRKTFGEALPISFSAGIDRQNYPAAVRLGFAPVTVCTDLLRQGGYGRLQAYGRELASRMAAAGAATIAAFRTALAAGDLAALTADPRYRSTPVKRRKTGQRIFIDDCSMCDLCIPACPNAAIFPIPPLETSKDHAHQIAVLVDLCNECGNCEVFCPDGGAPNRDKYRVSLADPQLPRSDYLNRAVMHPSHVNFVNCLSLEEP